MLSPPTTCTGAVLPTRIEHGARRIAEIVALDELRVGAACVRLQVDADGVHAGLEHAQRDVAGLRGGPLVGHHDVGKDEPRKFGAGAPELVAHRADRLRRIHAREREEIHDVAAGRIDAARLAAAAVHRLHVGQEERVGKPLAERRHHVRDALALDQRRPHFDDVDSPGHGRRGHRESLIQCVHVHRNLNEKRVLSRSTRRAEAGCVSVATC
jgi:hypothetical protein